MELFLVLPISAKYLCQLLVPILKATKSHEVCMANKNGASHCIPLGMPMVIQSHTICFVWKKFLVQLLPKCFICSLNGPLGAIIAYASWFFSSSPTMVTILDGSFPRAFICEWWILSLNAFLKALDWRSWIPRLRLLYQQGHHYVDSASKFRNCCRTISNK